MQQPSDPPPQLDKVLLNAEDHALLRLLADAVPLTAIARQLCTSPRTVRRRTRALCERLGVQTPIQAVAWAARRQLI